MKITVNRELLEANLLNATAVMKSKSLVPILEEALLTVKKDHFWITASSQEIQMTLKVECEAEGELQDIVCDIRVIHRVISSLKSEEIILELKEDILQFYTTRTRNRYEVPIQHKAEDFPAISSEEWSEPVLVNGIVLSRAIKKVSTFVNPNDIQILRGINLVASGGSLKIQGGAQPSFCFTEYSSTEEYKIPDLASIILPKSIVNTVGVFEKSNSVQLSVDKERRSVKMYDGTVMVTALLLEGKFPDVEKLLEIYARTVNTKFNKDELAMALNRLSAFTGEYKQMVLDLDGDNVVMRSEDVRFKKKGEELLEVEMKSDKMTGIHGINISYLQKVITTFGGENIYMSKTSDQRNPFYLTDDSSEGFSTTWMIAPVMLNQKKEE